MELRKAMAFGTVAVLLIVILVPATVIWMSGGVLQRKEGSGISGKGATIRVFMHDENRVVNMALEEYLVGVVAAEMPASFEMEALKAQAVAARTYAVKQMAEFGGPGLADHPGADVSTDPAMSQAWISREQMSVRWGASFDQYRLKITQAVTGTTGLIAIYDGQPINAVFHSTCGEKTASAKEVWGFDHPYLQSVACSWDKKSPRHTEAKEVSFDALVQKLGSDAEVITTAQSGKAAVAQIVARTDSGRVEKARIGVKSFSGAELRQLLGLRSSNFTVETKGDRLIFRTIGYGHGVGLCQYGADGMAKEGKNYAEILGYYYRGIQLKTYR